MSELDTKIDGIDYGPLVLLVGTWKGDKGMDTAPESDGTIEENPFYEELLFEPIGDVDNADKQHLAILRYHQQVFRKSNNEQFHDQLGYWTWDAATNTVTHSFVIPRGVSLVAGGEFDPSKLTGNSALLKVEAKENGDWGVAQSPFMRDNAKTTGFKMNLKVDGDKISYSQTTFLYIYGKEFDHTDKSNLTRV